ncbi:MAG: YidC/Oxa1 family membrane protein insertase, partial [Actinomycetota bacterium]|nr:YidC/Oxa1 family membrane protein insertase [Actinomycetota bacterium]
FKSMKAMIAYTPQIKAVQEKYKDDKERQRQEVMKVYQENKINPLASCIPLILQLPVFLALYQLLNNQEFKDRVLDAPPINFFFVENLTEKATGGPLIVLILLFIGTQLGAGLVMAARVEGSQRIIMFALPLVFAPFVATFPAALAVYWIATNVWTLGQQVVVKQFFPPPEIPTVEDLKATTPPPAPPRKKKKKRR